MIAGDGLGFPSLVSQIVKIREVGYCVKEIISYLHLKNGLLDFKVSIKHPNALNFILYIIFQN